MATSLSTVDDLRATTMCVLGATRERIMLRCMSLHVLRFLGRLHDEAIHAQQQEASEKRQGTKSRYAAPGYRDLCRPPNYPE